MLGRLALVPAAASLVFLAACGGADTPETPTSQPEPTATVAPTVEPAPVPTATPVIVRQDILATRLKVPSVGIDQPVGLSRVVPYTYVPDPGCPAPPPEDDTTLTVPNQGIVTPEELLEGLENKAYIFGHSRWLGAPGVLLAMQDINLGDELFIDGVDRATGTQIAGKRFVVDGIYLSDVDSGGAWLNNDDPSEMPHAPQVVLQTSVRERGAGRAWILDRAKLTAKAENIIDGAVDDPCRYLLLFITASPG